MEFAEPIKISRSTHYGNNYYVVYSKKIHRICHFFSNLEYYNFLSLEINPAVHTFCEQPLKIDVVLDNQIKHAIFDMWVLYKDGREELQEVKYSSELQGNSSEALRSQEQIRREEEWCKNNNINFVIRTEQNIPQGRFFLNNANTIAAHLRRYIPTEEKYYDPKIINIVSQYGIVTIEQLINNSLLPLNFEIDHLCYMYEKGLIKLNINNQPLGYKTEVSLWEK